MLCGYLIWLTYRNKNDNTNYINGQYFNEFCKKCYDIISLEDELINRIFVQNAYSDEYNKFLEGFFGEKIINKDNLVEYIIKISLDDYYLSKVMTYIINYIKDKHTKGKIGGGIGSPKKKCTITDKFRHLEKYNLTIGQEFDSAESLSKYTNKTPKTITQWRSKGWIS